MENYLLITGASSGIGRGIAVKLSKNYPLILGGRNVERLEETRAMCHDSDKHIFWNYDLADVENISDNLTAFIKDKNLKVGGFIHSAGVDKISYLAMVNLQEMRRIMDINFFSSVEILKVLIKKKINSQNLQNVVFISSISAIRGAHGQAFYSATKGAVDSFAQSMAIDLAPNIRVNTINPGITRTSMTERLLNDKVHVEQYNRKHLLGICEVEDVANMAEFLMSEKACRITGQHFVVDGGYSVAV